MTTDKGDTMDETGISIEPGRFDSVEVFRISDTTRERWHIATFWDMGEGFPSPKATAEWFVARLSDQPEATP